MARLKGVSQRDGLLTRNTVCAVGHSPNIWVSPGRVVVESGICRGGSIRPLILLHDLEIQRLWWRATRGIKSLEGPRDDAWQERESMLPWFQNYLTCASKLASKSYWACTSVFCCLILHTFLHNMYFIYPFHDQILKCSGHDVPWYTLTSSCVGSLSCRE